jgi:divalent metal cation (Fe/Co/Zn/Cd) transporter
VRRSGNGYFADLSVAVPRLDTFQHTEALVERITDTVERILPQTDVVVHTVPREGSSESIFDKIRGVASRNNVGLHDVSVHSTPGGFHVEQHLELPETMPLRDAHKFVCDIESQMRRELPEIRSVLTHIESEPATIERPARLHKERSLEEALRRTVAQFGDTVLDVHDIVVRHVGDRVHLSCHCTLPDDMPMHKVHDVITELENRFKLAYPQVSRVLIHPEPLADNKHERQSKESLVQN